MEHPVFLSYLERVAKSQLDWRREWEPYRIDEAIEVDTATLDAALGEFFERLRDNYPFFHPTYIGQMVKPPHPVAMFGYMAGLFHNPNNHALEGGPATAHMEKEAVAQYAKLFGYDTFLGHLTGGGTLANLEALWVSRELHPDLPIVVCENAHYTHTRMSKVVGFKIVTVPADTAGRMDINALRHLLETTRVGTVIATLGTTSLGALDPLDAIIPLKQQYGFRVHVDSAYGGHFATLAHEDDALIPYRFIQDTDSIVVDPHKHGLQPYGCGCVIFKDPNVGQLYKHDSPYTYFSSDELHLGEISLECSRPGAVAAALWLTLKCFPLEAQKGFGPILNQCLQAARQFAQALKASNTFKLYVEPDLDIVTYYPLAPSTQAISDLTMAMYHETMKASEPVYVVTVRVPSETIAAQYGEVEVNSPETTILRSVLMKPEQQHWVDEVLKRLEATRSQLAGS